MSTFHHSPKFTETTPSCQPGTPSCPEFPLIIAHRAMIPGAIPNTVEAIAAATAAGADLVELDVRLSLDRVPVLIHDAMLGGTTSGHGWVGAWPALGLRRLHLRAAPTCTIPRLDDVLATLPAGVDLALHLKDRRALMPVLTRIRDRQLAHRTWLWLDRMEDSTRAIQALPTVRVTLLRPDGWHPDRRERYFTEARAVGATAVSLPAGVLDTDMVDATHQHRLRVFTRIDAPAAAPALVSLGVDGLITTDPAATRRRLR